MQLVQVLECIGQQLDNWKQTDIIYLDMSKAFDRVLHDVFLDKLQNIKASTENISYQYQLET